MNNYVWLKYENGKVTSKTLVADENVFRFIMSLSATPTGGSAYNTLAYQVAEELVSGSSFAWAEGPGVIVGVGLHRDHVIKEMMRVAPTVGQMDPEEVEQNMKPAFGLSDEEKERIRRLGGIQ